MKKNASILIVGHGDVIENSLLKHFRTSGFNRAVSSTQRGLDVLDQSRVKKFFKSHRPQYVFLSSVRSGGIAANVKYAAEFIYENLEAQNNIIQASYASGVKKLLYFSGSCAYPREARQPLKEESLLTGPLEMTSEPYSVAKIAGVKLCQAYRRQYGFNAIVAVPATLYGPGSGTELESAHVIGSLMAKFYQARRLGQKAVVVWGTGKPRREFLYADDFVRACLFLMDRYADAEMINVGCGYDVSIRELAEMIKAISGFDGKIVYDRTKPDGTMRKLVDNRRLSRLGWKPKVSLAEGIRRTYQWYQMTARLTEAKRRKASAGI